METFELEKVRLGRAGGLAVTYTMRTNENGVERNEKHNIVSTRDYHKDLQSLFDELKPIVAKTFGFTRFCGAPKVATNEDVIAELSVIEADIMQNIVITGLSFAGKGESEGVIITARYFTEAYQETKICTPRIKFALNAYGFEDVLARITDAIESEAYQYLYEDKTAETSDFEQTINN